MKRIFLASALVCGIFAFGVSAVHAQARSYHYLTINDSFDVHPDTTVSVHEDQLYQYVGTYHLGFRDIPHKGLDAITNVSVTDGNSLQPLRYSSSRLDKNDPNSWGKYAVFEQNGETNIEWYYNLSDTEHHWILDYTIHGALAFYTDHDELYWNLFTAYDVPVDHVIVQVHLPGAVTTPSASFYTTNNHLYDSTRPDDAGFAFSTSDISPHEAVTFAVGWQKGLVDQNAYWRDFFKLYWPLVASVIVILGGIIYSIIFWIRQNRRNRGRGTIIPEYDPPENLTPAMASVVTRGGISPAVWPASMIDLAVRGFVKISEDAPTGWLKAFQKTHYFVDSTGSDTSTLLPFEREFLTSIFSMGDGRFSTKTMSNSQSKSRELYKKLQSVEKLLDTETQDTTHAFEIPPGKLSGIIFPAAIMLSIGWVIFIPFVFSSMPGGLWFLGSLALAALMIIGIRYVPHLNTQGNILKEEWLGFKMYLETAEKYRMQNLTPDRFEKFLPYAMIFGVEKEWARAFETLNLPPPSWYGSSAVYASTAQGGGFSPSAFASGFGASFTSSFAASGGGASGGGGGAGGGGGGGGGGAA